MPVAGVLVVPSRNEPERILIEKLGSLEPASVQGVGDKGIAIVLEAETISVLEETSRLIRNWDEVIDLQIAYLNWEDLELHAGDRPNVSGDSWRQMFCNEIEEV